MDIEKAIYVIDKVSTLIVEKISDSFIASALEHKMDRKMFQHVLEKWNSKNRDFFDFYLNSSDDVKRWLLEELAIEVEPDPFPDYNSRVLARLRDGRSRWDIYPFETEILYRFMLFGNNNGLNVLRGISSSAWQTVEDCGIDSYGNYLNWSVFWFNASPEDKKEMVDYLIKGKEVFTIHPDPEYRRNQAEFLNNCPEEGLDFHARRFRCENAACRYYQLASSVSYDRLKFFYEEWLQGLPADTSADMERLGFEKCRTMPSFARYVNERTDIGMDEWMKDHLSSEDYKSYKKSEQ